MIRNRVGRFGFFVCCFLYICVRVHVCVCEGGGGTTIGMGGLMMTVCACLNFVWQSVTRWRSTHTHTCTPCESTLQRLLPTSLSPFAVLLAYEYRFLYSVGRSCESECAPLSISKTAFVSVQCTLYTHKWMERKKKLPHTKYRRKWVWVWVWECVIFLCSTKLMAYISFFLWNI